MTRHAKIIISRNQPDSDYVVETHVGMIIGHGGKISATGDLLGDNYISLADIDDDATELASLIMTFGGP